MRRVILKGQFFPIYIETHFRCPIKLSSFSFGNRLFFMDLTSNGPKECYIIRNIPEFNLLVSIDTNILYKASPCLK